MPYGKITLTPGVNTEISRFASVATWVECNLIRWFQGILQKLGGWKKLVNTQLLGTARGIHTWTDLQNNPYIIIGTDLAVEIYDGGIIENITPIRATHNVAVNFSTVSTSTTVTIVDSGHGAETGDGINLITQVSAGGIVLYGYYQVTVVDVDTYTVQVAVAATATVNNGGAVPSYHTINTQHPVTVTLNDHGYSIGAIYPANVSTAVGGLTISGSYVVATVPTTNTFTIDGGAGATSTATASENGGNVRIVYYIHSGSATPTVLAGYGGGDYGDGDYGLDNGASTSVTPLRQWFFDTWGQDAIGNPTNGTLYVWIPPFSANPNMTAVSGAPTAMTACFVAMPQQIVVALGAEVSGTQDPKLVRWCDVDDYNDWTASSTNQAGSFRIPTGSRIVGGFQTPFQAIIWTDLDAWAMQYVQPPFIFGFNRIGNNCGLIAARAATALQTQVYWMGAKQFYVFGGGTGVQTLPCTVWDFVFNNLDPANVDKIFTATNSLFNEISWFFPSLSGGGEVDSYVKYCTDGGLWDYGYMVRTCWEDQSAIGPPVAVDGDKYLQQHETSNDADGTPMDSYALSSFSEMAEGQDFLFVDQALVNVNDEATGTTLDLVLYSAKNTASAVLSKGPYPVTASTQYVSTRLRGRFLAMRIGSSDLGSFWRFGAIRFRYSIDGKWG